MRELGGDDRHEACVTTAVVASSVTMRAHGHQAPLFSRPLTTRCLALYCTPKGGATPSDFPLSAVPARCDACNQ